MDPSLLVPDPSLSIADGAVAPFKTGNYYPQVLRAVAIHMGADETTPWEDLTPRCRRALLNGLGDEKIRVDYRTVDGRETYWYIEWEGIVEAVKRRYAEAQSDAQKDKLGAYFATVPCETCGGRRLKPEILAVTVGGRSIHEVTEMSARESFEFFEGLSFTGQDEVIAAPIVKEIKARLKFLVDVGLDYLTLERATATLSGGEAQRIRAGDSDRRGTHGRAFIFSTSLPSDFTNVITSVLSPHWKDFEIWAIRLLSSNMMRIPSGRLTSWSIWVPVRGSMAAWWLRRARLRRLRIRRGPLRLITCRVADASRFPRSVASRVAVR